VPSDRRDDPNKLVGLTDAAMTGSRSGFVAGGIARRFHSYSAVLRRENSADDLHGCAILLLFVGFEL
jgi:hypothetical protein